MLDIKSTLKISKRLKKLAQFIIEGETFADIGSDHGYVPCYICSLYKSSFAIATELNSGPYESTKEMIQSLQLSDQIDIRIGDGFMPIKKGEISTAIIAGMGGTLITHILNADIDKVKTVNKLILQPNADEKEVRYWLYSNGFNIINEVILEDKGHIYEIIVAQQKRKIQYDKLNEEEYFFGPNLLREKNEIFMKKWKTKHKKLKSILLQIENNAETYDKIEKLTKELHLVEGILNYDNESTDFQ